MKPATSVYHFLFVHLFPTTVSVVAFSENGIYISIKQINQSNTFDTTHLFKCNFIDTSITCCRRCTACALIRMNGETPD